MTARLLVLMGSGETSPTMVKTHRALFSQLGPGPVPAVLLDTPFGFQSNADDLTARAQAYFADSVGEPIDVAQFRSALEQGGFGYEAMLDQLRKARYVFAGPGSPTYALRQWEQSSVPQILADKLRTGGCVTFASAAALTLGVVTVPVYEIYKAGIDPAWLPGLDLLAPTGLSAAVIPHYNNAEGGNHDTRFCYLGEDRLASLERELPDEAFVLGIDEHTGCIFDLDAATATVVGLGVLTVRAGGRSRVFASGEVLAIEALQDAARALRTGPATSGPAGGRVVDGMTTTVRATETATDPGRLGDATNPLLDAIGAAEAAFVAALEGRDAPAAAQAVLDLEAELHAWIGDSLESDDLDRGRSTLRSMVVRLGQLAEGGARDPRDLVGPFVEAMLEIRTEARADKRYADADSLRNRLTALGVEIRDTGGSTEWVLV